MTLDRLRLFTAFDEIPEGCAPAQILFPFTGTQVAHDGFDCWVRDGADLVELVGASDAHVAALPFSGEALLDPPGSRLDDVRRRARSFVSKASEHGLKTLVMVHADTDDPVPLPQDDILVLRHSMRGSRRRSNEWSLPAWHEDLLARYCGGSVALLPWTDRPQVGFCGLAASTAMPITRRAKLALRRALRPLGIDIPHNDGTWLRQAAMHVCSSAPGLATSFIVRGGYYGGPPRAEETRRAREREEYVENHVRCGYALCVRGWGNFSFRFFEALSLGRVPVLIDTDCVLPLEDELDYDEFVVRVPDDALATLPVRVEAFHRALDDRSFSALQSRIRAVWLRHLSPLGFYRAVVHRLLASKGRSLARATV